MSESQQDKTEEVSKQNTTNQEQKNDDNQNQNKSGLNELDQTVKSENQADGQQQQDGTENQEQNQQNISEQKDQSQQQQEEEQQSQSQQQQDEQDTAPKLRKVAEPQDIPTEQDELLKFLIHRIQKTEEAITDTQELILQERESKNKLKRELQEKDKLLMDLLEKEDFTIQGKVKKELKETLDSATEDKLKTERENEDLKDQLRQKNEEIQNINNYLAQLQTDFKFAKSEQDRLNAENNDCLSLIKNLQKENLEIRKEKDTWDEEMNSLRTQLRESQQVVTKLQDVKAFLNKINVDQINDQQGSQSMPQNNNYGGGNGGYGQPQQQRYGQDSPQKFVGAGEQRRDDNFWYQKK